MYFLVRFNWDKIDCTRLFDRIVGCFDTSKNAEEAIIYLPFDEFRNAVAIVRFPVNEFSCCAEPDAIYMYDEESGKYRLTFEPYIENQYFYM